MKLSDFNSGEIANLRNSYRRELKHETMASNSVRRGWWLVILALDAELGRRFNETGEALDKEGT
jgi:hypothetical protein